MPSRKWQQPNLEDFEVVELTKTSRKKLSELPVDLSSVFEQIEIRSRCGALHIHQVAGPKTWNKYFASDYYLPISSANVKTLFDNGVLLTVYGYIVPVLPKATLSGRKNILANLVKYGESFRDPSFIEPATYSYQKYAHPDSFDSILPLKRKSTHEEKPKKRIKVEDGISELLQQRAALEKKLHDLNVKISNEFVHSSTSSKSHYCCRGHEMIMRCGLPQSYIHRDVTCGACLLEKMHVRGVFYHCATCKFDYCVDCAPKYAVDPNTVNGVVSNRGGGIAIHHKDKTVTLVGNKDRGGDAGDKQILLVHVVSIVCTNTAFAALKLDGTAVTWGDSKYGGDGMERNSLVDISAISSNSFAFAAIKQDGRVIAWGASDGGGSTGEKQRNLIDVLEISSTSWAFAARKVDGTVVVWGHELYGGCAGAKQDLLCSVEQIVGTSAAFAARRSDGSVIVWGEGDEGGDHWSEIGDKANQVKKAEFRDAVQKNLTDITFIASTKHAFAALKADGNVITWGNELFGGDPGLAREVLVGVEDIVGAERAFAARKKDNTIVCWGDKEYFEEAKGHFSHILSLQEESKAKRGIEVFTTEKTITVITHEFMQHTHGGWGEALEEYLKSTGETMGAYLKRTNYYT